MSHILYNERPVFIPPSLIKAFGFSHATVIQQFHFLSTIPNSGREIDGVHWFYATYEELVDQFHGIWDVRTVRKYVRNLEKLGIIVSCTPKSGKWNHTKHYRLDYEVLDRIVEESRDTTCTSSIGYKRTGYKCTSSIGYNCTSSIGYNCTSSYKDTETSYKDSTHITRAREAFQEAATDSGDTPATPRGKTPETAAPVDALGEPVAEPVGRVGRLAAIPVNPDMEDRLAAVMEFFRQRGVPVSRNGLNYFEWESVARTVIEQPVSREMLGRAFDNVLEWAASGPTPRTVMAELTKLMAIARKEQRR